MKALTKLLNAKAHKLVRFCKRIKLLETQRSALRQEILTFMACQSINKLEITDNNLSVVIEIIPEYTKTQIIATPEIIEVLKSADILPQFVTVKTHLAITIKD